ncbi:LysR family transcriptional regulator [Nocardiopsis sp. MG754419]|uniref:LysR family transcriptional regulator n=1 Tax=Nocardiopsis sp. MG754419 TaxID=2259865 RepID=UPI001BA9020E|nr:LysR family transcriptional regulator [Nocardiopsis sp. MG754419]MBR8742453.1 LysR family transcriptional regulator [Nocardiopsis sp. MG754419]
MTDWDLRKLRVLRTLQELGTVRATAEALSMTPSAVSQQLSSLSHQVGVALLEAHGRRVRLTDAAHVLLRHTDVVLAQLERAEAELDGFVRGEAGRVRVGSFATAIPTLVVPALHALRRTHPHLRTRVHQAEAAEVYELLAAGEVDIVLSLAAQVPGDQDGRYERGELLTDPLDVALPAGHRSADAPAPHLRDLAEEQWIFGASGPWRDITLAACAQAGFVPVQGHVASDWRAILDMVAAGLGVALIPRLAAAGQTPGVVLRTPRADRPRRHVVWAVRAGSGQRPQIDAALSALNRIAADLRSSSVQIK